MNGKDENPLVYSTDRGRHCPQCGQRRDRCQCQTPTRPLPDGETIRVRREVKGRKGKTVTLITGLPLDNDGLLALSREIKSALGTGGSVKNGIVLIQGDHIQPVIQWLDKRDYHAKQG